MSEYGQNSQIQIMARSITARRVLLLVLAAVLFWLWCELPVEPGVQMPMMFKETTNALHRRK